MKKTLSKDKSVANENDFINILEKINRIEEHQKSAQSEVMVELKKTYDFEKSAIVQIASNISKMSEKINALTKELEDKNTELNLYREGFGFRIKKATFLELLKLKQFASLDNNENYLGIIDEIFDQNEIHLVEAYEGMKFDAKRHIVKGIQSTTNKNEDDTIFRVNSEGYYVMDNPQSMKVLKYAEVVLYKWEVK